MPCVPFVLFPTSAVAGAFGPCLDIANIALHGLFVEAIQSKSFAHGGLLRARPYLVDGIEGMAKDTVCRQIRLNQYTVEYRRIARDEMQVLRACM